MTDRNDSNGSDGSNGMEMKPSETLERMRGLLARMERAVTDVRSRRLTPEATSPMGGTRPGVSSMTTNHATGAAPASAPGRAVSDAPAPIPFSTVAPNGQPKARAKSLEEFDAAFRRLASRQAG